MVDLGVVTHVCICGSMMWRLNVMFDDFEISMYMLDMECVSCGAHAKAPTPIDRPGNDDLVTV